VLKFWNALPVGLGRPLGNISFLGGGSGRKYRQNAWERKQKKIAEQQAEVDRILDKIREKGIQSLTRSEKKILMRATRRQQERERGFGRIDRL